ncbi:MAG: chemotaxis-specific protein-glutamate methyltransferase CheB [Magnetococcales bacterium]|nr:chemotaxis-specific protein-glutamate methyltransferase CheB [Magnetococcales bacterium]
MIRVLLVDDSLIALTVLQRMLKNEPGIKVVGTAANGIEALSQINHLKPNVVCTDLHMPKMDGWELTRQIMARHPLPILVVSVSVQEKTNEHNIFELLEAGAVDVFPKPRGGLTVADESVLAQEFVRKIKIISGVVPISRHASRYASLPEKKSPSPSLSKGQVKTPIRLVVIGASTGGPQALLTILSSLPARFPTPILCVQHISFGFLEEMISWMKSHCKMPVEIAQVGKRPQAGVIYFPPERSHLVVDREGQFAIPGPADLGMIPNAQLGHCPSVDVVFHSAARRFGRSTLGVLLTGMGKDGAEGLLSIYKAGGMTIAQDEASSVVFGMPKQAIELGAARVVLPVTDIAPFLMKSVQINTGLSHTTSTKPGRGIQT